MFHHAKIYDFAPGAGADAGAHTAAFEDAGWHDIAVPGDVHTALIDAGRISDPFYDQNERECAWMEQREWWYRLHFDAPATPPGPDERDMLVFHGLDTYATIWLNGERIGQHQNMFCPAAFDVTARLRPGESNVLALCFDRPLDHLGDTDITHWWEGTAPRVAMRKAQFGYGWDWGPRLPTIGIWRPVELRRERAATLTGVHFATVELDPDHQWALLSVRVEAEQFSGEQPLAAQVRLIPLEGGAAVLEQTVALRGSGAALSETALLRLDAPQIWWTHDLGEPALYTLEVTLQHAGSTVDQQTQQVGIRTIALDESHDYDEPGTRFFRFVLNGVPIFAKGANWIPCDSFVGAIPPERYMQLLHAARDANMNMLRVWGGGIYEHDVFYDQCDALGMLVWQDFMFACATYPEDDQFAAEVEQEAIYQVRRLRSHPCMALWCGNNENQWLHDAHHWQQISAPVPGVRYYHDMLPRIVAAHDGRTPYWPGSPFGGNDHNAMEEGDRHNWDAWHGNRPFRRRFGEETYRENSPEGVSYQNYVADMGRFISEFGMHAAPARATLEQVIPPDQLFHHSPAMDHHNKDNPKNKGDNLMADVTGLPDDLDHYIEYSMIAQAEGLKFAIEHYRRRKPHCSGTLFWQFNDCWPVLSWSVLDYYGTGKAGYYYAKRAYAPILASFKQCDDDGVELWITNDTLASLQDSVALTLQSFAGELLWSSQQDIAVPPNASIPICYLPTSEIGADPHSYLAVRSATDLFSANRHFFAAIKDCVRPVAPLAVSTSVVDEHEMHIRLRAAAYAYFVSLAGQHTATEFSDNYFDLEPGEQRAIFVRNAQASLKPEHVTVQWSACGKAE